MHKQLLFLSILLLLALSTPLLARNVKINQELLFYLRCQHQPCDSGAGLSRMPVLARTEAAQAALLAVQQKELGLASQLLDSNPAETREPITALVHACVAESQQAWGVAAAHFEQASAYLTGTRQHALQERATLNYGRAGARALAAGEGKHAMGWFQEALRHQPSNLVATYGIERARTGRGEQPAPEWLRGELEKFYLAVDVPEPEAELLALLRALLEEGAVRATLPEASLDSLDILLRDAGQDAHGGEARLSELCQHYLLSRRFHTTPLQPELFADSLRGSITELFDLSPAEVPLGPNLIPWLTQSWGEWTLQSWTATQDPLRFPDALFLAAIEQERETQEQWYRIQGLRIGEPLQEEARVGIYSPPITLEPGLYVLDLIYSTSEIAQGQPVVYLQGEPRFVAEQYGLRLPATEGRWQRVTLINRAETTSSAARLLLYSSAIGAVRWRHAALYRLENSGASAAWAERLPLLDIAPLDPQ